MACATYACLSCKLEWMANYAPECPNCGSEDVKMIDHDEMYDEVLGEVEDDYEEDDCDLPW